MRGQAPLDRRRQEGEAPAVVRPELA